MADAEVMLKILILEVGQVDESSGGLDVDGVDVVLLQVPLVDHDNAAETLRKGLKLQVTSPFPGLPHLIHVLVDVSVFVLVQEVRKELLVGQNVLAGLFSHEPVGGFIPVHLVADGSEQAVAVPSHVPQLEVEGLEFPVEVLIILDVLFGEFELVALAHHLLPGLLFGFSILLAHVPPILDLLLLVSLPLGHTILCVGYIYSLISGE